MLDWSIVSFLIQWPLYTICLSITWDCPLGLLSWSKPSHFQMDRLTLPIHLLRHTVMEVCFSSLPSNTETISFFKWMDKSEILLSLCDWQFLHAGAQVTPSGEEAGDRPGLSRPWLVLPHLLLLVLVSCVLTVTAPSEESESGILPISDLAGAPDFHQIVHLLPGMHGSNALTGTVIALQIRITELQARVVCTVCSPRQDWACLITEFIFINKHWWRFSWTPFNSWRQLLGWLSHLWKMRVVILWIVEKLILTHQVPYWFIFRCTGRPAVRHYFFLISNFLTSSTEYAISSEQQQSRINFHLFAPVGSALFRWIRKASSQF